ncbi:MAG: SBBP repeat-containing protein [Gammaproteobacteria bacterium]|nr:SBBP repeat-containing protein [Gammaproteobacteria bacterium]MBU1416830.1 SBBP repeat-containing protein [Gammaproteobacteria bacterium]
MLATALLFAGCGGGGGSSSATTYTIGGTVSGLSGTLVLQNNGGDDRSVTADGAFTFATAVPDGSAYAVTVLTQPAGQTCTVSNGSGTATANVDTLAVQCVDNWSGTKQLGVANAVTKGRSVATDANGNVYVTGETYGGLDGNTKTGIVDFFLTKYDNTGSRLYTRQLGAVSDHGIFIELRSTYGQSVATDTSGNVYVAGETSGEVDGNAVADFSGFFLIKYDGDGNRQYIRQLEPEGGYARGHSVATDSSGNVYVAGETSGDLDGNSRIGTTDFFVTKYDGDGNKLYTRQLGVAGAYTYGNSVATDGDGNVYVAGATYGGLDDNTLTGPGDYFLTKYDSDGNKLYTRQLGVAGAYTYGNSVATDGDGNVYVAGETTGVLDDNTLTGTWNFFVTKYDSNGNKLYTRQLGVAGAATGGNSVATDADGNVYVAGTTGGSLDGADWSGGWDFFVTKYDSDGNKLYTRQLGVAGAGTYGTSVATDADGNVFVAGETEGGLDGNTLTGTIDFFVTKYSSDGVKQ